MKFKKIYVEITNVCNFACSFCFKSKRKKTFISPEKFSAILFSIRPYTDYIYLHVLGEPLMHPDFDALLTIAESMNYHINLTTNGSLLMKKRVTLSRHAIRQYNISLHDAEENIREEDWKEYWRSICDFSVSHSAESYFSLRLWNIGSDSSLKYNQICQDFLKEYFHADIDENCRNVKLKDHVFLQKSRRFSWPGECELHIQKKKCYALRDHISILADGTVVPCCLDADGAMDLGNILDESLEAILSKKKACNIRNGFMDSKIVEDICSDCGFVMP